MDAVVVPTVMDAVVAVETDVEVETLTLLAARWILERDSSPWVAVELVAANVAMLLFILPA